MSNDLLLDENFDLYVGENGETSLCTTKPELVRQKLYFNLSMVRGEWKFNLKQRIPLFEGVLGKGTKEFADVIYQNTILETEDVNGILSFDSEVEPVERKYKISFISSTTDGDIPLKIEV